MTNAPNDAPAPSGRWRAAGALLASLHAKSPLVFWTAVLALVVGGHVLLVEPLLEQTARWRQEALTLTQNAATLQALLERERAAKARRQAETARLARQLQRPSEGQLPAVGQQLAAQIDDLARQAGLRQITVTLGDPRQESGLLKISARLAASGDMNSLATLLALAAQAQPPLLVESYAIGQGQGGALGLDLALCRPFLP